MLMPCRTSAGTHSALHKTKLPSYLTQCWLSRSKEVLAVQVVYSLNPVRPCLAFKPGLNSPELPCWLSGKEFICNTEGAGDAGLIPGRKIPWRRAWQPIPVFLPGKSNGQKILGGGYSPWGHKESVMAKHTQSQFWSRFLPHLRLSVLCLKTDFSYEFWFKRKLFYLLPIGFPASFWTSFHLLWIQFGTLWIFILSFSEPSWGTYWESYIMYYYTWHWKTQPLMSFWWPLSQQLLLHLNPPWH